MNNFIRTIFLLGILSVLLISIGGMVGGREGIYFAFVMSLLINGGSYFFSEKIALASSGAKPLPKEGNERLYGIVERLSQKIQIPTPKLYITPMRQANAFATGRGPGHSSVAVTQGLMDILNDQEIEGVLAHELSHVKNRDILVATIAAVIASSISFVSNMALWGGGFGGNSEDRKGAGIFGLVLAILTPIAALIIQMAISRQREFGADEKGAKTLGSGKALATALVKIHESANNAPSRQNPAFSSLYIGNPLGGLGGGIAKLFSTHPPLEERVSRLEQI